VDPGRLGLVADIFLEFFFVPGQVLLELDLPDFLQILSFLKVLPLEDNGGLLGLLHTDIEVGFVLLDEVVRVLRDLLPAL